MFCHHWTFPQILQPLLVPLERELLWDQEGALFPIVSHYTLQERCKDQQVDKREMCLFSYDYYVEYRIFSYGLCAYNWSISSAALIMQMSHQLFCLSSNIYKFNCMKFSVCNWHVYCFNNIPINNIPTEMS